MTSDTHNKLIKLIIKFFNLCPRNSIGGFHSARKSGIAVWSLLLKVIYGISSNIVDIDHSTTYSTRMELDTAALILSKIGNPTRLKIVRLLVRAGDQGMPVGAIQKKLQIPGSTLTHHITHLKNAGLIIQQRHQASLFCKMEFERLNRLVAYLTEECCVDDAAAAGNKVA